MKEELKNKRKIYTSWERYEKMINSMEYRDVHLKVSPIAKAPGQMDISYRYSMEKVNTLEEIKKGALGYKTIYPIRLSPPPTTFNGFNLDLRHQLKKDEVQKQFRDLVDRYVYKDLPPEITLSNKYNI